MLLDMKTVVLSYVISTVINLGVVALLWQQNRRHFNGLGLWLAGYAMLLTGISLIFLRGNIPDWLSIVAGNALVVSSDLVLLMGLERFFRRRGAHWHNVILFILFTVFHTYFTFISPNLSARVINLNVTLLVIYSQCAWLLLRRVDAQMYPLARSVGFIYIAQGLGVIARAGVNLAPSSSNDFFTQSTSLDSFFVIVMQMLSIILTFGLFLLVTRRLLGELETNMLKREQVESELNKTTARLQSIFDMTGISIAVSDLQGRWQQVNQSFLDLLGYTEEELYSLTNRDVTHPEDIQASINAIQAVVKGEIPSYRLEKRYLTKQGKTIWADVSVTPLRDERGRIVALIGTGADITERKKNESALRQSQELLSAFFESSPESLGLWDAELNLVKINTVGANLYRPEVRAKGLVGRNIVDLMPRIKEVGRYDAYMTVLRTGEPFHCEDVKYGDRLLDIRAFKADIHLGMIITDVTEKIRAQEALRESEKQFHAVIDLSPIPYALNNDAQNITYLNSAFIKTFGYDLNDIPTLAEWWPRAYPNEAYRRWVAETWQARLEQAKAAGTDFEPLELNICCKDGSVKTVWGRAGSLGDSFAGVHLVILYDVTEQKQAEALAQIYSERLQIAIAAAEIAVWDWNVQKDDLFWDDKVYDIYGVPRGFFKGGINKWSEYIHPDDRSRVITHLQSALRGECEYDAEFRIIWPDGSIHNIKANSKLFFDENHTPIRMVGTNIDVTERKQAEEALASERLRLAGIIEGTHVGTWEWNIQTGETVFNERWADIIGYTLDEISPVSIETWMKFTHPDDLKRSGEQLAAHFKGELAYYDFESRMKHKNGEWIWVLDRGKVVSWTEDGKPQMMLGTHTEVTERKQAEQRLQEITARFESFAKASRYGFGMADLQGNITYVNHALADLLGEKTVADCLGKNFINRYYPPAMQEKLKAEVLPTALETGHWRGELELFTSDGKTIPTEESYAVVYDADGKPAYLTDVLTDITERKQTEEIMTKLTSSFAHLSGKAFFEAVCEDAANILGLDFVFVGRLTPNGQSISVLGGCAKQQPMDLFTYELSSTPCANVIGQQMCYYPSNIQQLFPHDDLLKIMGVEGYMGIPLFSKDEQPIGIMVGLHSGALTHIEKIQQIFYIYIDRVASELLRSLSEAALLSSENKYRSLMELAGDALFVADVEPGSITDCNAKACQLIGKDKQDIIGLHQTQLHPAEKREEYGQLFQQVASAGRTRVSDVLVLHSDGHTIPVDISVNTFDLDGKIVMVGLFHDITERKRAAEEIQRLYAQAQQDARIKADLLNEVNHRVKNNLTRIQSIFKLKNMGTDLNDKEQALLTDMQSRIGGMLAVHNMLSDSLWSPLELGQLCWQIVRGALGSSPIKSNLTLDISFQPESCSTQMVIPGQATTLALILNELAMNSVKYAFINRQSGRIQITASLETENGNNLLQFTFRDDGPGWSEEVVSGQREGLGLRLIRGSLQGLPKSRIQLLNDGGAVTVIQFKLALP